MKLSLRKPMTRHKHRYKYKIKNNNNKGKVMKTLNVLFSIGLLLLAGATYFNFRAIQQTQKDILDFKMTAEAISGTFEIYTKEISDIKDRLEKLEVRVTNLEVKGKGKDF